MTTKKPNNTGDKKPCPANEVEQGKCLWNFKFSPRPRELHEGDLLTILATVRLFENNKFQEPIDATDKIVGLKLLDYDTEDVILESETNTLALNVKAGKYKLVIMVKGYDCDKSEKLIIEIQKREEPKPEEPEEKPPEPKPSKPEKEKEPEFPKDVEFDNAAFLSEIVFELLSTINENAKKDIWMQRVICVTGAIIALLCVLKVLGIL